MVRYYLEKGTGGQIQLVFEYYATQPNLQSLELNEYTKIITANDPQVRVIIICLFIL
jgi:hypothetical protein